MVAAPSSASGGGGGVADSASNALRHPCAHEADIGILSSAILEMKENLRHISDLLMSNAVLEEQANTTRKRLNELDERLRTLEISLALTRGRNMFTERVMWAIVCAALAGWKFMGGE